MQTLVSLRDDIAAGRISSVEATQQCLDRIAKLDGGDQGLGAFLSIQAESAVAQAKAADEARAAGQPLGMLAGVPIAIKDNICIKGVKTTAASRMLENFVSPYDATVIQRLKAAGAVLVGKCNLDEFAMGSSTEWSALGRTRNPWDPGRVPGGSSGGSAVAVAARLVPAALGSDTGGSIRQPASLCGVTGLKPTYGRVSRFGLIAFASSLDQIGPITQTAEDSALLMNVLAGRDPRDSTSLDVAVPDFLAEARALATRGAKPLNGLRVGVLDAFSAQGTQPAVLAAVEAGVAELEKLGAKRVRVSLPNIGQGVAAYYLIAPAEASSNLARYDGVHYGHRTKAVPPADTNHTVYLYAQSRSEGFGPEVKRRIMLGTYVLSSGYYDAYYLRALKVRRLIKDEFDRAFQDCDMLALPTSPTTAWQFGALTDDPLAMYLADIFTITINLAGVPGLSIPCGFDDTACPSGHGLPVGLQLVGPNLSESALLGAAHAYQQVTDWHAKAPM